MSLTSCISTLLQMSLIGSSLVMPLGGTFVKIKKIVASNGDLNSVVDEALANIVIENNELVQRLSTGVDTKASEFTELDPSILSANPRPPNRLGEISKASRIINWIRAIADIQGLTDPIQDFLSSASGVAAGLRCPFVQPTCLGSFRTIDGSCNNVNNPLWGSGFTPFARLIPAQYEQGTVTAGNVKDLPRQTGANGPLPSPRTISNIVHSASSNQRLSSATIEYTYYGQFLSHDITDTPMETGAMGSVIQCCDVNIPTRRCEGIPVDPSDPVFSPLGRTCLDYARSTEGTDINCQNGIREQLSIASAFLDGTGVYGHTDAELALLRTGTDGLLRTSIPNHFPFQTHPNPIAREQGCNFFRAGDEKVSEVTGLTAVTQVWQREHNRIAKIFGQFDRFASITDPTTRDQDIFDETRKLVIALIQHVTYREYIPMTVGPDIMAKFDLGLLSSGFYQGYDETVNPTLLNVVATAAGRFGHSMLRSEDAIVDEDLNPTGVTLRLKNIFFRSNFYLLFENGFQRGEFVDNSERFDRFVVDDVRNHLFETIPGNGNDLVSLNIQRARDHGLGSYNDFRAAVGLSVSTEFTNGAAGFNDMRRSTVRALAQAYDDPDDVDVWSGGISENRVSGGQIGPLFAELLGRQYERIRVGDRFWYERDTEFTAAQLREIRRVRFSRVLCDNVVGITQVQRRVFRQASQSNPVMQCSDLSEVNLDRWQ